VVPRQGNDPRQRIGIGFTDRAACLKRDAIRMKHHRALAYCLSMIFSENRRALFRILL
jgi:hypothetical protein